MSPPAGDSCGPQQQGVTWEKDVTGGTQELRRLPDKTLNLIHCSNFCLQSLPFMPCWWYMYHILISPSLFVVIFEPLRCSLLHHFLKSTIVSLWITSRGMNFYSQQRPSMKWGLTRTSGPMSKCVLSRDILWTSRLKRGPPSCMHILFALISVYFYVGGNKLFT